METFKFKILNPRSALVRRKFGDSVSYLFNQMREDPKQVVCGKKTEKNTEDYPDNLAKIRPISYFSKENCDDRSNDSTPVKKLRKFLPKSQFHILPTSKNPQNSSWLKHRDPDSLNSSRRFWSSLELGLKPILKCKQIETPDLWRSYASTPFPKEASPKKTLAFSCNVSTCQEILSFYSLSNSIVSSPKSLRTADDFVCDLGKSIPEIPISAFASFSLQEKIPESRPDLPSHSNKDCSGFSSEMSFCTENELSEALPCKPHDSRKIFKAKRLTSL